MHTPVARQNPNTINILMSRVDIEVVTDFDKAVARERVILLGPDGTAELGMTDENGKASFNGLPYAAMTSVFVVLPDVLEAWSDDDDAKQIHLYDDSGTSSVSEPVKAADDGDDDDDDDLLAELEAYRAWSKDQIETRLNGNASTYRKKDRTKHLMFTIPVDSSWVLNRIRVDRLTEGEKFEHFRNVTEDNGADYQPPNPYLFKCDKVVSAAPDPAQHTPPRWRWGKGAICNSFANLFLSYWFNYNSAFTRTAVMGNFLSMLENDSSDHSMGNNYLNGRGFKDCCKSAVTCKRAATDELTDREKFKWNRAAYAQNPPDHFLFIELKELTNSKVTTEGPTRDADGNPIAQQDEELTDQLAAYNIFEMAWDKDIGFSSSYASHGGIMVKEPAAGNAVSLKKFSADGRRKADGTYTKQDIEYEPFEDNNWATHMINDDLHLRIYPLKSLRAGGYAPGTKAGEYKPDGSMNKNTNAIAPHFHHSLSRFIEWR